MNTEYKSKDELYDSMFNYFTDNVGPADLLQWVATSTLRISFDSSFNDLGLRIGAGFLVYRLGYYFLPKYIDQGRSKEELLTAFTTFIEEGDPDSNIENARIIGRAFLNEEADGGAEHVESYMRTLSALLVIFKTYDGYYLNLKQTGKEAT
jgi:hypothetical protein